MNVHSLSEFLGIIRELQAKHSGEVLYFRGESQGGWELRPSIMRDGLLQYESEMLTQLISRRPGEFTGMDSSIAQWVLAQHHGLQTRFLDVTKNPLVSLFHASETRDGDPSQDGWLHIFAVPRDLVKLFNSDTASIIANFAKLTNHEQTMLLTLAPGEDDFNQADAMRHLYQLIREEKPFFEERIDVGDLFKVFVIEPQLASERIRAQSGAFLASAFHQRFEREEIVNLNPGTPIYAHYTPVVPGDTKWSIRRQLELLNITRETLFPSLDESAKAITDSYLRRLAESDATATDTG